MYGEKIKQQRNIKNKISHFAQAVMFIDHVQHSLQLIDGNSCLDIENKFVEGSTMCLHVQSRICQNLKHTLQLLKSNGEEEVYESLVGAVIVGPADVDAKDAANILGIKSVDFLRSKFRRNSPVTAQKILRIPSVNSIKNREINISNVKHTSPMQNQGKEFFTNFFLGRYCLFFDPLS